MNNRHQRLLTAAAVFFFLNSPANASEMDDRIEAAAANSYVFKTYLKEDSVKVDANKGVVTLTGTVEDLHHKSLAGNTVENLPGVIRVDNHLAVRDDPAADNSDGWLGLKVKTALLLHSNPFRTHVSVQDGVVTLTGEVENKARKDLATEYAKDVSGVKDVKNELVISSNTPEHKMKEINEDAQNEVQKARQEGRKAKADAIFGHSDPDNKIDDASITAQAKMALIFHRSTSGLSTKVETHNGTVILTGNAKSSAERELATKIVNDIRGVKNVINSMDVVDDR